MRHLLSQASTKPPPSKPALDPDTSASERLRQLIFGPPRNLNDRSLFRHLSLAAFLAWVGLGADGLSSSCYGPAEAFRSLMRHDETTGAVLGDYRYLAVLLALATIATVFIISACYSHIIEEFPSGGGGYVVASKLLGRHAGVVSGCALVVDYVLTITVSIAAAGDALFGLLGTDWNKSKLPAEMIALVTLIVLNLRGVKESIRVLLPIFLMFLVMHVVLLLGVLLTNLGLVPTRAHELLSGVRGDLANPQVGLWGMVVLLFRAYSLGAGTYTGIEAVSNSMPVMREPRVQTGQQTMRLMAWSLSLVAGGLIVSYLLLNVEVPWHPPGVAETETMNQRLAAGFFGGVLPSWLSYVLVLVTIVTEGALLIVAAQAGFIGGPASLANMALDSWAPHSFRNLSERLTTHNGVLLMGLSALAILWATGGRVSTLVLMYSINVFVTFSLSMVAMVRMWWTRRENTRLRWKRLSLFGMGAALCVGILCVTVVEKFTEGGWITLALTGGCVGICLLIHSYYSRVHDSLKDLDQQLMQVPVPTGPANRSEPDPSQPTAVVLVGGYNGLGIHTMLTAVNFVPGHFRNVIFISVGIVDSGSFKGADSVERLQAHTQDSLKRYVDLAQRFGFASTSFSSVGTDVVDELEKLCLQVAKKFPKARVFAGQLMFQRDTWYQHLLHNYTAFALQRRLHWRGLSTVIVPTRIFEEPAERREAGR